MKSRSAAARVGSSATSTSTTRRSASSRGPSGEHRFLAIIGANRPGRHRPAQRLRGASSTRASTSTGTDCARPSHSRSRATSRLVHLRDDRHLVGVGDLQHRLGWSACRPSRASTRTTRPETGALIAASSSFLPAASRLALSDSSGTWASARSASASISLLPSPRSRPGRSPAPARRPWLRRAAVSCWSARVICKSACAFLLRDGDVLRLDVRQPLPLGPRLLELGLQPGDLRVGRLEVRFRLVERLPGLDRQVGRFRVPRLRDRRLEAPRLP